VQVRVAHITPFAPFGFCEQIFDMKMFLLVVGLLECSSACCEIGVGYV